MVPVPEEPSFDVLVEYANFEVRKYERSVQARLLTTGEGQSGRSGSFRRIARYIFGGNRDNRRIAMTAPVQMWENDRGSMMSFTMPSEYALDDLPTPTDPDVKLIEVEEYVVAVLSFSGFSRTGKARRLMARLQSMAKDEGLTSVGSPVLAVYDNPGTTLPFMRRNEIHLPIEWTD